ncbi:hypothetical protein BRD06_11790 [Halobacteriales archaeon QS_9_67_15]|nr:MAG: hypothetical protein BRD06_11790 [Halobacteriales archaeon QS_9_67_15]
MSQSRIGRVAVLGAGTMGHGIAEVAAIAGYSVALRDVEREYVDDGYENVEWSLGKLAEKGRLDEGPEAVLDRVDPTTDLEAAVSDADLVIEAVPERLALKREVFAEVEGLAGEDTILASNTSSIPITDIAEAADDPGRVLGLHFFTPPVRMGLVEVVHGKETREAVAERAAEWVESVDKTPIHVRTDVRGFVVNTVLGPYISEAAWMVSDGEATIRQADAALVHDRGYPMGPFEIADLTGIDVGYDVRTERGREVPPVMAERVEAGDLGRKTGRGYYDYEDGDGADYEPGDGEGFDTLRVEARMVDRAAYLVGEGVATPDAVDTGARLGLGRFEPHPYLVELVEGGRTGEDAGAGFHEYDDGGSSGTER